MAVSSYRVRHVHRPLPVVLHGVAKVEETDPSRPNPMGALMTTANTMWAADASAGPDDIAFVRSPIPRLGSHDVRVRVTHSAVEDGEAQVLNRTWVGTFLHRNARPLVLGWNVAGVVDAVGARVSALAVGDPVWGHLDFGMFQRQGAYAELVTMREDAVAKRPDAAIALAKQLGARAVGVCSTKDVAKVERLGADRVIDRKQQDFLATDERFDVVLDTPSKYSFGQCSPLLAPGGTYVDLHPWTLPGGFVQSLLTSKRCRFAQVASRRSDLEQVGTWITQGMPPAVQIDSRFPVSDLAPALKRRLEPARAGQVVVEVSGNWPS